MLQYTPATVAKILVSKAAADECVSLVLFHRAGTCMSGKNFLKWPTAISNVLMHEFVSIPVRRAFTAFGGFT